MSKFRVERRWIFLGEPARRPLAWALLNFLCVKRTERTVRNVANTHLAYMPYSHFVATALSAAVVTWLVLEFRTPPA